MRAATVALVALLLVAAAPGAAAHPGENTAFDCDEASYDGVQDCVTDVGDFVQWAATNAFCDFFGC